MKPYDIAAALAESLKELTAWKRGEVVLPSERVEPAPPIHTPRR